MNPGIYAVAVFGAAVVFFHGLGWIRRYRAVSWRHFLGSPAEALLYGIMIFLLLTNSGPQSAFVYFQF